MPRGPGCAHSGVCSGARGTGIGSVPGCSCAGVELAAAAGCVAITDVTAAGGGGGGSAAGGCGAHLKAGAGANGGGGGTAVGAMTVLAAGPVVVGAAAS
mmetsp:Transcript_37945/g.104320  ORF Transcript_37945/g.104320 Transcript_37945/m.104320 type:complete len:99 (+) Transcript_37945:1622-1918(+)